VTLTARRIVRDLVDQLADARAQAWLATLQLREAETEVTVLEAVGVEQEREILRLRARLEGGADSDG
jgi:hypothetical protein